MLLFLYAHLDQMQPYTDCSELHLDHPSGTYVIRPNHFHAIKVYCDQSTSGGGWTVSLYSNKNFFRNATPVIIAFVHNQIKKMLCLYEKNVRPDYKME